ncbi:MAG: regulatory protein RecX [Gammaproteobacteria bacterium]
MSESDSFSESDEESNNKEGPDSGPSRHSAQTPRNQAMNWLARREYSRAELRSRLATKDYETDEIEAAIAGLVSDGLVSDERFAESFIAVRMRKGQGPVRIRLELEQRGVDPDTIRTHLEDVTLDWHSLAREVRERKFGLAQPLEFKEKARQMRFLEYRGFSGEHIRTAMHEDD